ncbi:phytanoyl-dioxygenase family protein [Diplodia corticola]|uniref:Phytanoyl-dioxygenase family protein n=1 Tax=Diplodia corticola TaxID=236234 RepID=A0A1J9S0C8_9PEZI|nr:phytanoyl-dioxygenase family protein [Diplodia corticola]OJD34039.1 phytanoyl-dioxygenase family protein [Diplodia corticola]
MERQHPRPLVIDEDVNLKLVRRFTQTLDGTTPLETGTKQAQLEADAMIQAATRDRLQKLYDDGDSTQDPFDHVEFERKILEKHCIEYVEAMREKRKSRRHQTFRRLDNSESREEKLEQLLQQVGSSGVEGLQDLVQTMEADWERSHSKAFKSLQRFCKAVDSHAPVFKIFPSDTLYTSTLCGALTVLVQASVNHSHIADLFLTSVVSLSEKVSGCSSLLYMIRTQDMRARLANVYSKYFEFLCSTIQWFLKGKFSRSLDSFNDNFSQQVESARAEIDDAILEIIEASRRGHMAMDATTFLTTKDIEKALSRVEGCTSRIESKLDGIDAMRQTNYNDQLPPGAMGHPMVLLLLYQTADFSKNHGPALPGLSAIAGPKAIGPMMSKTKKRSDVEPHCEKLKDFVDRTGITDGIELSKSTGPLVAESFVIHRLANWMAATPGTSELLWIITPMEFQDMSSATLAALGTIQTAAQANASFIAAICKRPHRSDVSGHSSPQEAGCIALLYSLICQLIRFNPTDDTVELDINAFERLARQDNAWELGLEVLETLLTHTPVVGFCIIDSINVLETDELGEKMCEGLVRKVLAYVRTADSPMRVLFTTPGQSRVLHRYVQVGERVVTDQTFVQTQRRGQHFRTRMLE